MSVHVPLDHVGATSPAPRSAFRLRHLSAPHTQPAAAPPAPLLAALIPADQVPAGVTVLGTVVISLNGLGEADGGRGLLRQDEPMAATTDGAVQVDLASRTVLVSGRTLALTRLEFDLLALLVDTPRRVFTRAQLHASVWEGVSSGGARTVDVHVHRLRHKLGPAHEQHLVTVRGVGYRWDHDPNRHGHTDISPQTRRKAEL
jgi:Response regulators consisting of a CheY-like receiver domain and a winged-helix DNA-binding domain